MRRGIATALVLDALARAREQEVTRVEVTANGHALAFYKSVGFISDGMARPNSAADTECTSTSPGHPARP